MHPAHLPPRAGVGLKPEHLADIAEANQPLGFFEVHAENYMGAGGPPHAALAAIRRDYALSIHGVGLSIGGPGSLDRAHLSRLKTLCDRYQPESFSEHLAWSTHEGHFLNDLLPLPYTPATLARVAAHVAETQEALGRQMLLENPATYLLFEESTISETDFLASVVARTGCGLLLDVNNVFVSATNHGTSADDYLARFPVGDVREVHLAGHDAATGEAGEPLLIDAHGCPVAEPVWELYRQLIARTGPIATLIEWDNDVPAWPVLLAEAQRADAVLAAAATARRAA